MKSKRTTNWFGKMRARQHTTSTFDFMLGYSYQGDGILLNKKILSFPKGCSKGVLWTFGRTLNKKSTITDCHYPHFAKP